jgi:hypothetical protein
MESMPCVRGAQPACGPYVRDAYSLVALLLVVLGACAREGAGAPAKDTPLQALAPSPTPTTPVPQAAPKAEPSSVGPALERGNRDQGAGDVYSVQGTAPVEFLADEQGALGIKHRRNGASAAAMNAYGQAAATRR